MDDDVKDADEFDRALIAAGFAEIAVVGWSRFSIAAAARAAGLPLARAQARFPCRATLLMRFGRLADTAALAGAPADGPVRDRLFDMLMRRIDVMQAHRAGVLALLRALPSDPATSLLLGVASVGSMGWLLEAAGVGSSGPFGQLRRKGLLAVWLWTMRAWQRDESADLSATMAALDQALVRAGQAAGWLGKRARDPSNEATSGEDPPPAP